jgi:Uma2 family endonuclease
MSTDIISEDQFLEIPEAEWMPPMPPTDLIFDDGEPMESNRHRIAMNALIQSAEIALSQRFDFFVGGNMFIYFNSNQARNRDFRGPDFFVVLNVDPRVDRQGWVVWDEMGRYPDAIVELMSSSTADADLGIKKNIYEEVFRTPNYFVFDPFDPNSLRGWQLDIDNGYQEMIPDRRGWLWCSRLGLWLGTWEGAVSRDRAVWLRFYDPQGNLIPLPEELARTERERADSERERADSERERADSERERAERLAARLRALGENPDDI